MGMMRGITIATIVALAPSFARADDKPVSDPHFEKGSELKAKGDIAGACVEFTLAEQGNPSAVGMVLSVAQCSEELGKFHTAVVHFTRLKQLATELGLPEYGRTAEEHLSKLDKKPATLALTFDDPPDAATKVTVDDEVYDLTKSTTLEVNPGKLHLVVSHPDRVSREETIEVQSGEVKAFHVRRLALPVTVSSTRRRTGIIVTWVGGAAVVTGVVLVAIAAHNYNAQFTNGNCYKKGSQANGWPAMGDACDPTKPGASNIASARTLVNAGGGVAIAGGVAVAVGGYLWLFAPKPVKEKLSIVPTLSSDQAGFLATGHF